MNRTARCRWSTAVGAAALAMLVGCAEVERAPGPAQASPAAAAPAEPWRPAQRGRVSYYGPGFEGRPTASGATFEPGAMTMAHRRLPFGTKVRVTNLRNLRSVEVTVNDRGPSVDGLIADLSEGAARKLDMVTDGVVEATLEVLTAR